MTDPEKARERLAAGGFTCVLIRGEVCLESRERGVKPLLGFLESGSAPRGCCAADRVVGRAAAFLYVLLGVKALHAGVISRPAIEVLERYGVALTFDQAVDAIRNRAGTGYCPMEQAVLHVSDPDSVPSILRDTLKNL